MKLIAMCLVLLTACLDAPPPPPDAAVTVPETLRLAPTSCLSFCGPTFNLCYSICGCSISTCANPDQVSQCSCGRPL